MLKFAFLLVIFAIPNAFGASVPCLGTDQAQQWAYLFNAKGDYFESWKVEPDEIKSLSPPNGFKLGIQIQPVSKEVYRERLKTRSAVPELVEILWFDLSGDQPVRLRSAGGGSNSLQSYQTASIDGTPPNEMDDAPLTLWLQKTSCITLQDLENEQ